MVRKLCSRLANQMQHGSKAQTGQRLDDAVFAVDEVQHAAAGAFPTPGISAQFWEYWDQSHDLTGENAIPEGFEGFLFYDSQLP